MINIAIDGYAGSGKSTISKKLAESLNIKVLNTGAIYRGLACAFKEMNFDQLNEENVDKFLEKVEIEVKFNDDEQLIFVNGKDYTPFIRAEEISNLSSSISRYPKLRDKILHIQRDFAKENDCIMEGRDIATVVLPNATIKFFLTASKEERARRRFLELKDVKYEDVLKDIIARDYQDENRAVAPLKPATDSIIIDTTDLTLDEVVQKCLDYFKKCIEK